MTRLGFIALVILHGLIHLLGFAQAFELATISELTAGIARPLGILWLAAALLLVTAALALALHNRWWPAVALPGVVLSQVLVIASWQDAKFGSLPNLLILVVAFLSLTGLLFERGYRQDVHAGLRRSRSTPAAILTAADLEPLPPAVQRYLRYVGVVGKPKVVSMRALLAGEMRQKGRGFFPFTAEQVNFYDQPGRLFFMQGRMAGLTVPGYHRYQGDAATMDVRLFGLLSVVKVTGEMIYVSDTVTLFNDMCLLAPATLIDERIAWQPLDDLTVRATFTNHGVSVGATLSFNAAGQLVNFVSEDRWAVDDRRQYPFSTPVSHYRDLDGYHLPTVGEMIWHYPDGDFTYGKVEVKEIEYNIRALH